MMRAPWVVVFLLTAAAVSTVARPGAGQAQDPVARAAAVLAQAREALGGTDKLAEVKRLHASGTIRRGAETVNLTGELELFVELHDKFRRDESLTINAQGQELERKAIVNGANSWEETRRGGGLVDFGVGGGDVGGGDFAGAGGADGAARGATPPTSGSEGARTGGAQSAGDAEHRARQTEFARVLLALLLTSESPLRWVGTAKSPHGEADVLEINTADGTATRLLVDAKTRMPLMLTWSGVPQDAFATLVGRAGFGRGRGRGFTRGGGGGDARGAEAEGSATGPARGRRGGPAAEPTTLQMFLSDYRVVGGIKLPHLMTRGANSEITEEWIVKNYRLNSNFSANTFSK